MTTRKPLKLSPISHDVGIIKQLKNLFVLIADTCHHAPLSKFPGMLGKHSTNLAASTATNLFSQKHKTKQNEKPDFN